MQFQTVMNNDKQSLTLNVFAYDISETSLRAENLLEEQILPFEELDPI